MAVTPANKIVRGGDLQTVGTEIKSALARKQDVIQSVQVTVDNNTGTPSASGSVSGSTLSLSFQNLKGAQGPKGDTGATGPQGPQGPQGEQGNTGSSVDYPFELANNLTTDDPRMALSAAQGKVLNDKLFGGNVVVDEEKDISSSFVWTKSRFIVAANPESDPNLNIGEIRNSSSSASRANNTYVDISEFVKLRITLPHMASATSAPGLCFYDASHNVVSSVWRANLSPTGMVAETIDIPSGAKYVRTTWRSDYGSFTCVGIAEETKEVGGIVSPFIESNEITEDLSGSFEWTQGKYRTQQDGKLGTSSSTSSYGSNLVDVSRFDKLQVYIPQINAQQSNAGWAWYDKNGDYIVGDALAGASLTMRQVVLYRPKNAVYFATTKRTDGETTTFSCIGIVNERKSSQEISGFVKDTINDTANVHCFGAVGDGIVDDTASVLLAASSGARRIYFPAGTYLIGKTINVPSGVELFGDGVGATIIKWLGASNSVQSGQANYDIHYWRTNQVKTLMHLSAGGSNIYIHDLEFDGSDFSNSNIRYIGLSICGVSDTKIENVYIHDINYDSTRDPSVQFEYAFQFFIWNFSSRVVVSRCRGANAGYENIGTEDASDVVIEDSVWENGWRTSLQIHRGTVRTKVVNNTINNVQETAHASLTIHGVKDNAIDDVLILGNTILSQTNEDQGYRGGIAFVQSGFKNITIAKNTFDGNSYCIVDLLSDGSSLAWPKNLIIAGNILRNSRFGICLKRGNNYIIKDNIIDAVSTAIESVVTNYIIKDNLLTNNTTKEISGTEWQE